MENAYEIFGSGGGEREAKRLRVPLLGQIPYRHSDSGIGRSWDANYGRKRGFSRGSRVPPDRQGDTVDITVNRDE
jgi:hypothetical protein